MLHWMIRLSLIFVKKRIKKQLSSNLNRRSFDKITSRLECVYYLERVVLAYKVCIHIIWYFLWNFTHSKKLKYIKLRNSNVTYENKQSNNIAITNTWYENVFMDITVLFIQC